VHCRDGAVWYRTGCGFEFPVPFAEIGTATFYAEDRAPLFIRYIRRQQKYLAMAYADQHDDAVAISSTPRLERGESHDNRQ
jgi:hypothetical protein